MVGHVAYLAATAEGFGATGIGCFEDEPMKSLWHQHGSEAEAVASIGSDFDPLYHVAVGAPIKDSRIKTSDPYGHR